MDVLKEVALAEGGDVIAAVRVAVFIFARPESEKSLGFSSKYDGLLLQSLDSPDPEFLVAVGEELHLGKTLAPDAMRPFFTIR